MRALSSPDFLDLWERGCNLHPVDQGLLALRAALPKASQDSLGDWPLGRRNRALVALRCSCFGPSLKAWTSCNRCGEKLEFEVDGEAWGASSDHVEPIVVKGHSFRSPTSRDLARAAGETDLGLAIRRLVGGCLMGSPDSLEKVSEQNLNEIGWRKPATEPLSKIR